MENNPIISVVIPVYKVEQYLKRCIESVIGQTYKNLDIILVDDGSPDDCGIICDKYAKTDNRIRVIHKENGGLSDARNAALDIIIGEYVTCIDSDDFVSKYYIENLYDAIKTKGCLIACCGFVDYYDGDTVPKTTRVKETEIQVLDKIGVYQKLLYQQGIEFTAWGKLYKSSLFEGVRYPKGRIYEDVPTTYKLLEQVDEVAVIPMLDYYYFQRMDSIANDKFTYKKMDAIEHMNELKNFLSNRYPELKDAAKCRYFCIVCNILFMINDKKYISEQKFLWKEIKTYRRAVIKDKQAKAKVRVAALLSFFGLYVMKTVYNIFAK